MELQIDWQFAAMNGDRRWQVSVEGLHKRQRCPSRILLTCRDRSKRRVQEEETLQQNKFVSLYRVEVAQQEVGQRGTSEERVTALISCRS